MAWEVEYTEEFENWWDGLTEEQQDKLTFAVLKLRDFGPFLSFPDSSGVTGSKHRHMRELRVQIQGNPIRGLYAFDPRRVAMLLIGGDKSGQDRWYEIYVPQADRIYDEHLRTIAEEERGKFYG